MYSITSANSALFLSIPGLFTVPTQIQGFAADAAFAFEDVKPGEFRMGVDGKLSGGFTPYPNDLTISLMADSPSGFFFEQWQLAQKAIGDLYWCNGTLTIPGLSRVYTMRKGGLSGLKQAPDGKRVLEARDFKITFESIDPAGI